MHLRKMLIVSGLILGLGLLVAPGSATVVTSIPGGTVYPMPTVDYWGSGPQSFGPGITWTSQNIDSVFGWTHDYGFDTNGYWDSSAGPMAGTNGGTGTMTFTFDSLRDAVGGFLNYAPGTGTPVIAVYDAGNNLIENYTLNFSTGGGINNGFFFGFDEADNIKSFTLTGAFLGITDLTARGTAPLPSTLLLVGPGLLGLAMLRRRVKH